MARKYFGTDGMRGEANKDLTIDLVTNLGLALGYHLKKQKKRFEQAKSNFRIRYKNFRIYDKVSIVSRTNIYGSKY